jgi:uncharacterized repeat protein (TIGR04052 family)
MITLTQNCFETLRSHRLTAFSTRLIAVAIVALLSACSTPQSSAPGSGRQDVTLRFEAQINGRPFRCGERYSQVGSKAATVTPTDFRFYISDIELLDRNGKAMPLALEQDSRWQLGNIALLDFEDGSGPCRNGSTALNTTVRGSVAAGEYAGLRFTLGVPFEHNHADPTTAPAPLNNTAMFWNWRGGYKFLKVDMHGGAPGYSIHLGSTVCSSASPTVAPTVCANPNRVTVHFDKFDASRNTIVADIGRVLSGSDVSTNAPGTSPGCMSFPKDADCPPIMGALGLAYDGQMAPGPQKLFSVR